MSQSVALLRPATVIYNLSDVHAAAVADLGDTTARQEKLGADDVMMRSVLDCRAETQRGVVSALEAWQKKGASLLVTDTPFSNGDRFQYNHGLSLAEQIRSNRVRPVLGAMQCTVIK